MTTTTISKTALVTQGGGTRGAFAAGVHDVLLLNDIKFPYSIGTSAGALTSLCYVAGAPGASKTVCTETISDKRFLSLHNLITGGGIFNFDYLFHVAVKKLPFSIKDFLDSDIKYVCAATSMETGEATYFVKGETPDIFAAVAASSSLPLLSQPVEVEGKLYLDGGPTAAIPWRKAIEDGAEKIVVIMTRPIDYRKKKTGRLTRVASRAAYRKYPNFRKAHIGYPECYNRDVEDLLKLQQEGKAFIIAPKESLGISNTETNADKLRSIYDLGVSIATELLEQLKEFIHE